MVLQIILIQKKLGGHCDFPVFIKAKQIDVFTVKSLAQILHGFEVDDVS